MLNMGLIALDGYIKIVKALYIKCFPSEGVASLYCGVVDCRCDSYGMLVNHKTLYVYSALSFAISVGDV